MNPRHFLLAPFVFVAGLVVVIVLAVADIVGWLLCMAAACWLMISGVALMGAFYGALLNLLGLGA